MRTMKIVFFLAAFSLLGFTAGCRGCGCSPQRDNTTQPRVERPDKPKPEKQTPAPAPKRSTKPKGGDNAAPF